MAFRDLMFRVPTLPTHHTTWALNAKEIRNVLFDEKKSSSMAARLDEKNLFQLVTDTLV